MEWAIAGTADTRWYIFTDERIRLALNSQLSSGSIGPPQPSLIARTVAHNEKLADLEGALTRRA